MICLIGGVIPGPNQLHSKYLPLLYQEEEAKLKNELNNKKSVLQLMKLQTLVEEL